MEENKKNDLKSIWDQMFSRFFTEYSDALQKIITALNTITTLLVDTKVILEKIEQRTNDVVNSQLTTQDIQQAIAQQLEGVEKRIADTRPTTRDVQEIATQLERSNNQYQQTHLWHLA